MAKQTVQEFKRTQKERLVRELEQHKGGIKYAEGQVQEVKEQIDRIDNACEYCGESVYGASTKPEVMEQHIKDRHPEDYEALQEERRESAKKVLEAQVESS